MNGLLVIFVAERCRRRTGPIDLRRCGEKWPQLPRGGPCEQTCAVYQRQRRLGYFSNLSQPYPLITAIYTDRRNVQFGQCRTVLKADVADVGIVEPVNPGKHKDGPILNQRIILEPAIRVETRCSRNDSKVDAVERFGIIQIRSSRAIVEVTDISW